jgi:hypothetical protein
MELAGSAFFVAMWAASAIWAVRDAGRRCPSSLRFASTAVAILVPIVGAALYALARPCEERHEVRLRRLRIQVLEQAFAGADERCLGCGAELEPEFRCCPRCGERARVACDGCGGLVRAAWTACPWCAKQLAAPARLPEVA